MKKRGLGKGLGALLRPELDAPMSADEGELADGIEMLSLDIIERSPYQPRRHFDPDALQELAASLRAQGVVQPILVRPLTQGRYQLVAGERRWRAAQLAELETIPAVVRTMRDDEAAAVALIENIQREDLSAAEEVRALARLQQEFAMTHQQIADAVGRSRVAVSNLLRLRDLGEAAMQRFESGELEMGHARALLALDAPQQSEAAQRIVERALSVRAAEALVRTMLDDSSQSHHTAQKVASESAPDADVIRLQQSLGECLGAPVVIRQGQQGKGRVEIRYHSLEQLDGILDKIDPTRRST